METTTGAVPDLRRLHGRQRWVWTAAYGAVAVVVVLTVAGAEIAAAVSADLPWPPGAASAGLALTAGVALWWVPRAAFERWRYGLGETSLELRRGLIVRTHTVIPYHRVQHIDITRSPIERRLGLAQLVVRTAAAGTDATLPGIAAGDAEQLRDAILARAGRDDV